jgi:hypothetical protein
MVIHEIRVIRIKTRRNGQIGKSKLSAAKRFQILINTRFGDVVCTSDWSQKAFCAAAKENNHPKVWE